MVDNVSFHAEAYSNDLSSCVMKATVKWLSAQASMHKNQAKSRKNKKKKAIHRQKQACYQMALNAYLKPIDKSCLTKEFPEFNIEFVS